MNVQTQLFIHLNITMKLKPLFPLPIMEKKSDLANMLVYTVTKECYVHDGFTCDKTVEFIFFC